MPELFGFSDTTSASLPYSVIPQLEGLVDGPAPASASTQPPTPLPPPAESYPGGGPLDPGLTPLEVWELFALGRVCILGTGRNELTLHAEGELLDPLDPGRFGAREHDLWRRFLAGESTKEMAYARDENHSSIYAAMRRILAELGLSRREHAIWIAYALQSSRPSRLSFLPLERALPAPSVSPLRSRAKAGVRARFRLEASVEGPVLSRLTVAEREVALLMLDDPGLQHVARARGTSMRTVANQTAAAFRKAGVANRVELVRELLR
jgi:DNA-binding CsgD family transcriptional regulator